MMWIIGYILFGIFLAEGTLYTAKKRNLPFGTFQYVIITFTWPIMLLIIVASGDWP